MYNWKLTAFCVIGLILIAGVFNNTAMAAANDGKGVVTVAWDYQTNLTNLGIPASTVNNTSASLNAGSTHNILQFTYKAWEDDGDDNFESGEQVNMSGGRVRITFPTGWKVSKNWIQVKDDDDIGPGTDGVVYETDGMGNLKSTLFDTDEKKAKANATVTFETDRHITVNLGSEWSSTADDAGIRTLIIKLCDVTAPIPSRLTENNDTTDTYNDDYVNIEFRCSSSAKNGTLTLLSDKVQIKVGNILGDRDLVTDDNNDGKLDAAETRDPLIREVKVTPARVFVGDTNVSVQMVFEAPGPMYGSSLNIVIPSGLRASQASDITVSGRGGATLGDTSSLDTDTPSITINTIDRGQRVIVSYRIATVGALGGSENTESVTATTTLTNSLNAKVTGGVVSALAGSGKVDISPVSVEAGARRRDIILTYTAYTKLDGYDIEITPDGLVLDSTNTLQKTDPSGYGYVSGSRSSSDLSITSDVITWDNVTIDKNKTLRTTIRRVDISTTAKNYKWTVKVGPNNGTLEEIVDDPTTAVDERPLLTVVKTSGDAIRFETVGENVFSAGSQATIEFKFTADATPFRDGRVSLTIPAALGSAPTTAKDTAGRVTVTSDGTLEANQPTISGRTITVAIKRMDLGQNVTIKYGTDVDDKASEKALLHYVANDAVRVSGTFRASPNASTRSAGSVPIRLNNVKDGSGSATLSPTSIAAGSDNQAIEVVFTAAGTMDGGKVSLEIPSGWGSMQEDPTKRNYVTVRGSAVSSLVVTGSSAEATIRTMGKGGSIRFIYGGGTSSSNNGVEVQDDIGIAQFTIKSDGDGDEVFTPVTSDLKHEGREKLRNPKKLGKIYADAPGILQIEVAGALDGTGTVTVSPAEVRAAANDVQLVFTYTPSQTVVDGALRFTVPSGWSKPQVDELGTPGYTEVDGLGLGTATDDGSFSVTVPIFFLDKTQSLRITYGATDEGRVVAATVTGTDTFKIEVKGHEGGSLKAIQRQPTVSVTGQGSGRGRATITVRPVGGDTALYAGETNRTLTIAYTAAGQMVGGKIRLTIPPHWSPPSDRTLIVQPSTSARYDGQMVIVEGVNLNANSTINFIYTGNVQPTVETDVTFAVAVHSGRPGDSFADVSGADTTLTVDVKQAKRGSGAGTVTPTAVKAGVTGVSLTFTYTAVGEIAAPREFRVQVPSGWTAPSDVAPSPDNKGTYTVVHRHGGVETTTSIEKLAPVGRDMVARVRLGGLEVEAGDQIIFTYENADAPTASEVSAFKILFDGRQIQDNTQVTVGTGIPTDPTPPTDPVVIILTATVDKSIVKTGETVTVTATGTAGRKATFSVGSVVPNVAMNEYPSGTYTGSFTVAANVHDGVHAVTVNFDGPQTTAGTLTIDTAAPTVTVQVSPTAVTNGDTVTITATVSEAATSVTADVSALDTTQTAPIPLTLSNSTYSGSFTVSDRNQAIDGPQTITVTAVDTANNSGMGSTTVTLTNVLRYTSTMPVGVSLCHVPLDVEGLDTVGDFRKLLGSAVALMITYDPASGTWNSRSDDVMITPDLGIIVSMISPKTITFEGEAWGNGTSTISLNRGANLIGVPVKDPDVVNVSDLLTVFGEGVVVSIIVSTRPGQFHAVSQAGATGDGPIIGDAAYLITATGNRTATLVGTGWRNDGTGAAPISLIGYKVDGQTPVLSVEGAIVDEITGRAKEGFRVKVKNLSTKASLSSITSVESVDGYNMTFVDLTDGYAARVGDVLEISVDSPDPLIGVKPVRHTVTANDVKNSRVQLENLIAYEIPAETELLRNYPNPFNPETWIPYRLAEDADVSLTIYDSNGALVRTIDVGHKSAAVYESRAKAIYWDGRNRFGEQVASGVYFYSLSAGDFSATRKMLILK